MKKSLFVLFLFLNSLSTKAQLGYYNNSGFIELTPDESIVYKFVQAMDDESQETLNELYASLKQSGDKSLIKCTEADAGGWYVKKDYPLPDGNYYESALYNSNSVAHANELYVILPKVRAFMNRLGRIEDLLEYIDDRVTVVFMKNNEVTECTDFELTCNLKTSEEWLKLCLDVYNYGFEGLHYFAPSHFMIDRTNNSYLISMLTGDTCNNDERLIYEKDWAGVSYDELWEDWSADFPYPWEPTADGLAITTPRQLDEMWSLKTVVTAYDRLTLENGHNYIVRMTMKIPSDGTCWMLLGSLDESSSCEIPVTANDDFQVIDFEFLNFSGTIEDEGLILFGTGWVVGTTILKKVEVYERAGSGSRDNSTNIKSVKAQNADGVIYNLAGQKVNTSYKGIVIKNGKKVVIK